MHHGSPECKSDALVRDRCSLLWQDEVVNLRQTPRDRARAALTAEIKDLALRQLAESGAAQLSLRAVARDLGMVSSALYRYFPSRDHLLTSLITDAYADLADALAAADSNCAADAVRKRWITCCIAMREWGMANAHRFGLIYGTPVPGYRAPRDTTVPAERVMISFTGIVEDAALAGTWEAQTFAPLKRGLRSELVSAGSLLGKDIPPPVLARTIAALAQVIGMINLELGGHFVGGFEPADSLFAYTVERVADDLGLPER